MDKKNAFRQHYNIIIFTRNPDEENPEGRRTTSSVVRYVLAVWKQFSFILPSYYRSLAYTGTYLHARIADDDPRHPLLQTTSLTIMD
jgi:hypothetical protein